MDNVSQNLLQIKEENRVKSNSLDALKNNKNFKILKSESNIIDDSMAFKIDDHFPSVLKGISWVRYYSRFHDGTSYNTLLRNTKNKG